MQRWTAILGGGISAATMHNDQHLMRVGGSVKRTPPQTIHIALVSRIEMRGAYLIAVMIGSGQLRDSAMSIHHLDITPMTVIIIGPHGFLVLLASRETSTLPWILQHHWSMAHAHLHVPLLEQ
jgi:hypothetical protein